MTAPSVEDILRLMREHLRPDWSTDSVGRVIAFLPSSQTEKLATAILARFAEGEKEAVPSEADEIEEAWDHSRTQWVEMIQVLQLKLARAREALTPSAATKAAFIGEFRQNIRSIDEFGDELITNTTISWATVKKIMAAIAARAGFSELEGREP